MRVGSRSSPLGTSATSIPANAKISSSTLPPSASLDGQPGQARFAGSSEKAPTPIKSASGSSLAIVMPSTSRAPGLTPRTFTNASSPAVVKITAIRTAPCPAPGTSRLTWSAKALSSPEAVSHSTRYCTAPASTPRNGPKAAST